MITPRQLAVMDLIMKGFRDKEIARVLRMSYRTVESHTAAALRTLNAGTRVEGVMACLRLGLLRLDTVRETDHAWAITSRDAIDVIRCMPEQDRISLAESMRADREFSIRSTFNENRTQS